MRRVSFLLGLVLAYLGCSEGGTPATEEQPLPAFKYSLYENEPEQLVLLARRPAHLEYVYSEYLGDRAPGTTLFPQVEGAFRGAGTHFAEITAAACALDLPIRCEPDSRFIDEMLGHSDGPGARHLRKVLMDAFSERARQLGVETRVVLAVVNTVLARGTLKAATSKAIVTAEARAAAGSVPRLPARGAATALGAMEQRAAAAGAERLSGVTGRLRAPADVSAMAARMVEAEALEVSKRQTGVLEDLAQLRPSVQRPPAKVAADDALWRDYVTYWEQRFAELSGPEAQALGVRPPLPWDGYRAFRFRFGQALEFQREVAGKLRREAELPQAKRQWLHAMEHPVIEENVGLAHEGSDSRTYVDQLVVDEAALGHDTPHVETFSTKQRDFTRMDRDALASQVRSDAREALGKYGGTVEVRRPGHPLFERRIPVSNVHLVYDKRLMPLDEELWTVMETAAHRAGVEIHFHEP